MCLIAFAHQVHPDYPLILIANRDEFYERSTRKAQFWIEEGYPTILAGKDLVGKGTWLGVAKTKKWGALTNYRDLNNLKENPPTRGMLVLDYLKSNQTPKKYLEEIQPKAHEYDGFNLLLGMQNKIYHYSNVSNLITEIPPGVHSLSNALLNTPWRKAESLKIELQKEILGKKWTKKSVLNLLLDETKAANNELPKTGLNYEMEKAVSSRFIRTEHYGTRCSTVLIVDSHNKISFLEQTYEATTQKVIHEVDFEF